MEYLYTLYFRKKVLSLNALEWRIAMADYIIMTDSSADLPSDYLKDNNIYSVSLKYTLEGVEYANDDEVAAKSFYSKVRNGSMPTTSQVNPQEAKEKFDEVVKLSKNILCLSFSSGLSGTFNSFRLAAEEIMDEDDTINIIVIDSLCASLGQGLFVHKALENKNAGLSMEDNADWLEKHKSNFVHAFTVDDLNHLYRGGRLSKVAAVVGTLISLKPVLQVDDEGHLMNMFNVRGRKKSLNALVDYMEKNIGAYRDENDIVFISHGDNIEDARYVADEVKKRFGIEKFLINPIGPTIGAHAGPDTIALFFMGDHR